MTSDQQFINLINERNDFEEEAIKLTEFIQQILSIEEEGHRFDSDEALSEIFNKCRDILE